MSALPDASRVAFEAWLAIKDPRPFTPDAYSDQDYKWRGWQASRKQALEEAEKLLWIHHTTLAQSLAIKELLK